MKLHKLKRFVFFVLISCTFSIFLYNYFNSPSKYLYKYSNFYSLSNEDINLSSTNNEYEKNIDNNFHKHNQTDKKNTDFIKTVKISCPSCNFTPIYPPTSTRRDVVLAAALNKLKRVETFLRTLRMTGSRCRVILFLDNQKTIEPHFLRFFKSCDIEPVFINNNNNSILIGGAKMTRYYYYQQWLSAHINEVDRVLHSDTFDVLFQSDPFRDDMLPMQEETEPIDNNPSLLFNAGSNNLTKSNKKSNKKIQITSNSQIQSNINTDESIKSQKNSHTKFKNKRIENITDKQRKENELNEIKIKNEAIQNEHNINQNTKKKGTKTKNETKIETFTFTKKESKSIKSKDNEEQHENDKNRNKKSNQHNVLYFTFEPVSLGDSKWTASWVSRCYGPNVLHHYRKKPVSCSGVTIGYSKAFLTYLDVMLGKNSWRQCFGDSLDQAHHNYVLYHGDLKNAGIEIKSLDCNSKFLTMHFCCKKGKCHLDGKTNIMYGNKTNEAPVLVHQYNRWKNLTKRNKLFCPGSAKDLFAENKFSKDDDRFQMAEIEKLPPLKIIFPDKLM